MASSFCMRRMLRASYLIGALAILVPNLSAQTRDPVEALLSTIKTLARDVQNIRDDDKLSFDEQEAKIKASGAKLNAVRNLLLQTGLTSEQIMQAIYYAPNEISLNIVSQDLLKTFAATQQREKALADRNIEHEFDQRSWRPYIAPGQDVLAPSPSSLRIIRWS